jgi:hypothetical protein
MLEKEIKMIEFSLMEIVLFCWAVLATGYALKYKLRAEGADFFARVLIENKGVRDQVVEAYEKEFGRSVG